MIDLNTLSKSYPYLSLAKKLGLDYGDVLLVSELYTPSATPVRPQVWEAVTRVSHAHRYTICHVAAAIANGEIGHHGG